MELSKIDIDGSPADECEVPTLMEARKLIDAALRNEAKAHLADLDRQKAELEALLNGAPEPVKRAPAEPKYRDPATGNTWCGRGKRPGWMNGGDIEQYRITA